MKFNLLWFAALPTSLSLPYEAAYIRLQDREPGISYVDISLLRSGLYSYVYSASTRSDEDVVIKEATAIGVLELENELSWLRNLSHPNIATIIDSYDNPDSGRLKGFVLKHYPGGSLQNLIYSASFRDIVCDIGDVLFTQIVSAVAFMHKKNVCHVDLKVCCLLTPCIG